MIARYLLLALVTACSVETEADNGGNPVKPIGSATCKAESGCQSCATCFDRCVCQTNDAKKCVHACANGAGGSTSSGGTTSAGGVSSVGGSPSSGGAPSSGGSGGTSSPSGDCCSPTSAPGCSDTTVESCVCGSDDYCCSTEWDQICVDEIGSLGCGNCGSTATGGTGGGSGGSAGSAGSGGSGGFVAGAVTWLDFPEQQTQSNAGWSAYMTDVIRHLPLSYGSTYYDSDKVTYVHETTHGINAHLRNNFNNTGKKANALYVGANKAAIIVEPNIWKTDANAYVPASLRDFRYETYMTGATDWNDTPLYLFDEWVAYTNGTEAGVTIVKEGKWSDGWRDSFGSLEFTVYVLAMAMAVEAKDPTYFTGYPQFREFLKWNAERALSLYQQCKSMTEFKWDKMDNYYQAIGANADAAALRAFVKKTYGDAWAKQFLGF